MGRVGFMKANLCLAANYGWTLRLDSIQEAVKQGKYHFTIHVIERGKNEVTSLW